MDSPFKIMTKLTQSVQEYGVQNTICWIIDIAKDLFFDYRFDQTFGVHTCRNVEIEDLDVSFSQKNAAQRYQPTPVSALRSGLKLLSIDYCKYTFIDFGSGKGRVLLLASEYPYKQIIGIEFSENLHRIAVNNIKKWKYPKQQCFTIKSICEDARDFKLPNDPLILFFFTPFQPYVANQIISNIQESISSNPRSIYILYYGRDKEFIDILANLNFANQIIYSRGRRKVILFSSEVNNTAFHQNFKCITRS